MSKFEHTHTEDKQLYTNKALTANAPVIIINAVIIFNSIKVAFKCIADCG